MTSFKPGQKVAFISVREKGVISRIEGDLIYVEIEKGFEIPTFRNDLILLEDVDHETTGDDRGYSYKDINISQKQKPHVHLEKGLYFSVIPSAESARLFECYLINYTSYALAFHLIAKIKNAPLQTVHYDLLQAGDAVVVLDKPFQELLSYEAFWLQCLIVDVKSQQLYESLIQDFAINWNILLTPGVFQPNPFFDEEAYVIKIVNIEQKLHRVGELPAIKANYIKNEHEDIPSLERRSFFIDRFMIDDETAEVDLHADKIIPPSENIHLSEILRRQVSFAKQCLDSAREKGIKRLILIHGTGKGTLKFELYSMLRKEENIRYGEASLLKYGGGAIEVIILS